MDKRPRSRSVRWIIRHWRVLQFLPWLPMLLMRIKRKHWNAVWTDSYPSQSLLRNWLAFCRRIWIRCLWTFKWFCWRNKWKIKNGKTYYVWKMQQSTFSGKSNVCEGKTIRIIAEESESPGILRLCQKAKIYKGLQSPKYQEKLKNARLCNNDKSFLYLTRHSLKASQKSQ